MLYLLFVESHMRDADILSQNKISHPISNKNNMNSRAEEQISLSFSTALLNTSDEEEPQQKEEQEKHTQKGEDEEKSSDDDKNDENAEDALSSSSLTVLMIDAISENTMSVLTSYLNLYEALQMKQTCRHFHEILDPCRCCSFSNESLCTGQCRMAKAGCAPNPLASGDIDDEEDFFAHARVEPYIPDCHCVHCRDATVLEKVKEEIEENVATKDNSTAGTCSESRETILALLSNTTSFRCDAMKIVFKNAMRFNNVEVFELFLNDNRCNTSKETLEFAIRRGSLGVARRLLLEPQVLSSVVACKHCKSETGACQCSFQSDGMCPHDPQDRFCRGCAKESSCQRCEHYQCRECSAHRDDLFLYECDSCHRNICVRSGGDPDMSPDTHCMHHCSGCSVIQCFDCIKSQKQTTWKRCQECKKRDCCCSCGPAQDCYECERFEMLSMLCPTCQNECPLCAAHSYEAVGGGEEWEEEDEQFS